VKYQRGFSLIEVLVGLAILAIVGSGFLIALTNGVSILSQTDQIETAKNLAESQMEYVKELDYEFDGIYPAAPIPDEYKGFSASINASSITLRDFNMQKISVIISYNNKEVLTLEGYKGNR
jgi:prepilin-type N-terminal cleavage/methylation domain-containing protein